MNRQTPIPFKILNSREMTLLILELVLIATPVSLLFLGAAIFFLVIGSGIPHSAGGDMPLILFGIVLAGMAVYPIWHFPISFLLNRRPPLMPWLLGLILFHFIFIGVSAIQFSGKYSIPLGSWTSRTVGCFAVGLFLAHLDSLLIRRYRHGQDPTSPEDAPRNQTPRPVPKGRIW